MVQDRQKVWTDERTDGMDGRREWTDGRCHNYIPSTLSGDNKFPNIEMDMWTDRWPS